MKNKGPGLGPLPIDHFFTPEYCALEKEHIFKKSEGIAQATVFMCSDEASYITGANLPVDGGWTASGGLGQPDTDTSRIFAEAMAKLSTIPDGPK